MQLKRLVQGTVFTAVAAACALTGAESAKAAKGSLADDAKVTSVTVDTKAQVLKATASSGELLVGIGKVNAKNKTITVANWDAYDGNSAQTVDLSSLNNTKDNYIVLSSNAAANTGISVIKIPAVAKAINVQFDATTATVKVGTGAKAGDAKSAAAEISATNNNYEYRTAMGEWADLATSSNAQVSLSGYQEEGATLYIRTKGKASTTAPSVPSTGAETLKYGEEEVDVYVADSSLPGKEAKVKIAAKAKGPAVALDYVKGQVTLPKNSEYRVVDSTSIKYDASVASTPVKNEAKQGVAVDAIYTAVGAGTTTTPVTLEVRSTDPKKKKAASKWTRVEIAKAVAIPAAQLTAGGSATTASGGAGIATSTLLVKENASDTTSAIKATYDKVKNKDVFVIENVGKLTYEVATSAATANEPAADAKATKVAPGKKVTFSGVADGSKVYIRIAGDKKAKSWTGLYSTIGVVDYPKAPAAS